MWNTVRHSLVVATPALALVAMTSFLPGCGKAAEMTAEKLAETAIENETGGNAAVDLNSENGTFSIQAGDGENAVNMQAGENVALPDNLPDDVYIPDGVTWNLVQSGTGEKDQLMLHGTTTASMTDLAATLKSKATAQGWETVQSISQPGAMEMMTLSKGEKTLSYTLGTDDGKTTVMIAHG